RPCVVSLHEAAVADYIGGEDGGEFTGHDSKRERVAYLTRGSGVTEIIVKITCDPVIEQPRFDASRRPIDFNRCYPATKFQWLRVAGLPCDRAQGKKGSRAATDRAKS